MSGFIGHGIDIVETARVRQMLDEHGQRFLDRCFTPLEQSYCNARTKRMIEHLSGRFAAKEAVLKVVGTGWRGGIAWTDIEVVNHESGQPSIRLSGECAKVAESLGDHALADQYQSHRNACDGECDWVERVRAVVEPKRGV